MATNHDLVELIDEQIRLYNACTECLLAPQSDPSLRTISIASLHGQSGRRLTEEPPDDTPLGAAFAAFMSAIVDRIQDPYEPWHVRQLVNITTPERLAQVEERMLSVDGEHYEIRALVDPHSLNVFSPLIVADRHSFLSLDDNRYFRASTAMQFGSPRMARWLLRYFESMWNMAPFVLRDHAGGNVDGSEHLREALLALQQSQETTSAIDFEHKARPRATVHVDQGAVDLRQLISDGESLTTEFKQSLEYVDPDHSDYSNIPRLHRVDKIAGDRKSVVHSALKTIVAFLNSQGGTLLIGVHDIDGPVGIEPDYTLCGNKQDWDGFQLKLIALVKERIKPLYHDIEPKCVTIDGKTVCRIDVPTKPTTHYLDGKVYIRFANSSEAIEGQKLEEWLKDRKED